MNNYTVFSSTKINILDEVRSMECFFHVNGKIRVKKDNYILSSTKLSLSIDLKPKRTQFITFDDNNTEAIETIFKYISRQENGSKYLHRQDQCGYTLLKRKENGRYA